MSKDIEFVVKSIADTALKNEAYFSELDAVCGDGDLVIHLPVDLKRFLSTGTRSIVPTQAPSSRIAKIIMGAVGGVSGTIWGTTFLRAGMSLGTKEAVGREDVVPMLRAVIEGIKSVVIAIWVTKLTSTP